MDPKTGEIGTYDPRSRPALPEEPDNRTQAEIMQDRIEKSKKTPQFLAREEMAKRTEAARQAELKGFVTDVQNDDGSITPAVPIEDQAPEQPPAEPIVAEPAAEPALETAPVEPPKVEEELREVIVNGQRIKVPVSKIIEEGIRAVQKESAADMKLAAASQLERQLQERVQRFEQLPQGAANPAPQPQAQPSDEDAALAKAIQFGTEEEAKKAIASLRGRGLAKEDLSRFVREELAREIPKRTAFDEANNWVRSEHKEIFADPDLEQLFMLKETKRRESGDTSPYRDLYASIAQEIETKFQLRKAEAIATAPAAQDRITRKANAPRPVSGASAQPTKPQPQRQPTVTDYVQRQRELRGQVPLNRNNQGI